MRLWFPVFRLQAHRYIIKPQNLTRAKNLIDDAWRAKPNLRVFSAAAENVDEFARTHQRYPNLLERWDIKKTKTSFDPLALAARGVLASRDRTKQGFINFVETTEEELIIVVGHNDRGKFYFADGSSLPLKEMASLMTQKGKRHCFLSCVARSYVTGPAAETTITPLEAAAVVSDVTRLLEQQRERLSQQQMARLLKQRMPRLFQHRMEAYATLLKQPGQNFGQIQVQQVEKDSLLYIETQGDQGVRLQRLIDNAIRKARRQKKIKYIVAGGSPSAAASGGLVIVKMTD